MTDHRGSSNKSYPISNKIITLTPLLIFIEKYLSCEILMADITDFEVGQGETFKILLHIYTEATSSVPLDITNYTFEGQLRENYTTEEVAASINVTKIAPYASGSIYAYLNSDQTAPLNQRMYVYDLLMKDNSNPPITRRLLEGAFTIRPSVTR